MSSAAASESGYSLPLSRIGVFQSSIETLRTPAHDIVPYLAGQPGCWRIETVDDPFSPNAHDERCDALVLGFNAVYQRSRVSPAQPLGRPPGNLLVLHQRDEACWHFLDGDLAVHAVELAGGEVHDIHVPDERESGDEPLLNWPIAAAGTGAAPLGGSARALYGFAPAPESVWRVVLEAGVGDERVPVVLRSARFAPDRVIACSLLLEWREPAHAALLQNMLTYCAFGTPEIAVVEPRPGAEGEYDAQVVVERLRLRGARGFTVPHGESLDLGRWPLRHARHIVVPASVGVDEVFTDTPAARSWTRGGGVLVRMAADGGLDAHSSASDADWVAKRWAVWYAQVGAGGWQTRLSESRAILSVLAAIRELGTAAAFGADDPREMSVSELGEMLHRRLRSGSCEGTVSATAIALDVDRLTGGRVLSSRDRGTARDWLRRAFSDAPGAGTREDPAPPIEDQLDIARALADRELLRIAVQRLEHQPLTALGATRLREALVACEAWDEYAELPPRVAEALDDERVVAQIEGRLLLSSEFLSAVADLHVRAPAHPAADLDGAAARAALSTISAGSALAQQGTRPAASTDATAISTEALALIRHVRARPTATWQVRPESDDVPAPAVQDLLQEAARIRAADARMREDALALGVAIWVLSALAFATLAIALSWRFSWADVKDPEWLVMIGAAAASLGVVGIARLWRKRRRESVNAFAGDVLAVVGVAGAFALAYLAPPVLGELFPDSTLLDITSAGALLLVFGLATSGVLKVLDARHLAPPWGETLIDWLDKRNVPVMRRSRSTDEEQAEPAQPAAP